MEKIIKKVEYILRVQVALLKYIILGFTIILLGILLFYTQPDKNLVPLLEGTFDSELTEEPKKEEIPVEELITVKDVKKTVTNSPNFLGEDINKKLWSLKADKAVQAGEISTGFTTLYNVVANTLTLKDSKVDYLAKEGKYIPEEEKIILKGDVVLSSDTLKLETQNLEYNLETTYAESSSQVDIHADFGNIIADGMQSFNNAEKIILTGNVRSKFFQTNK